MISLVKNKHNMELWERLLHGSIKSPEKLSQVLDIDNEDLQNVNSKYPLRINPYYFSLIKNRDDAIYRQAVPDILEITEKDGFDDPLNEEDLSPVPGLTHKYPDRVLFLISSQCAMFCRFCNRKRKVGNPSMVTPETIREGITYIRKTKTVRDVLLSGGDPLLLQDRELFNILEQIRSVPHVEIIRIGTRVPCTLPQRITPTLTDMLKGFHPLFINTHFNHPKEITPEASAACSLLADAGIPMGCQTVLLNGVNNNHEIMTELFRKLLSIRVRPYYLFQADLAKGTSHFWTPLKEGIEIMAEVQGRLSGLCIPRFMIDLPGGGGKVPITPEYIKGVDGDELLIKNYLGEEYRYPIIS